MSDFDAIVVVFTAVEVTYILCSIFSQLYDLVMQMLFVIFAIINGIIGLI